MKISRKKLFALFAVFSMLIVGSGIMAAVVNAVAISTERRKTSTTLVVTPEFIGNGQTLTVNCWVWPPPSGPSYYAQAPFLYFDNYTFTFTRPDGSKDTFMPSNPSITVAEGVERPGKSEATGGMYFYYTPNQVGTWSVSFSFPGKTFYMLNNMSIGVFYEPATSNTIQFTVQEDPVNAGVINGWPWSPLPTGYWTSPVSPNNREWYNIAGDWLMPDHDAIATAFNPYSTAPETAHILWKQREALVGLVGGEWGTVSYIGWSPSTIILNGRIFYNNPAGGTFSCRDLRTGELVYRVPGSVTLAQNMMSENVRPGIPRVQQASVSVVLWGYTGSTWVRYDPSTGAVLQTITGAPTDVGTRAWADGDPTVYVSQMGGWNTTRPMGYAYANVIKWDYSKVTGNNWRTGIVWNVSTIQPDGTSIGDGRTTYTLLRFDGAGVVIVKANLMEPYFMAYDMETGKHLYTKDTGFSHGRAMQVSPSGPMVYFDIASVTAVAFDVRTGNKLWVSDSLQKDELSPTFRSYASAYDTIYVGTYEGHVDAIDATTGKWKWQSESIGDPTGETVWGATTGSFGMAIADGKMYWSNENPRDQRPTPRFAALIAQDAFTGKTLWRMPGVSCESVVIGEGYLVSGSDYDGRVYAFGKGKTETTVSAPDVAVPKGTGVLIQGTVMDMSPAQPDTPAVAKESMSEWMEYLHMQNATLINSQPSPKGVPVMLYAVDPNGNIQDIGTVTSDSMGHFKTAWTPPVTGTYTILASFAGDESYWSSAAQTALLVTEAPSAAETGATQTTTTGDNTLMFVGSTVAIIAAIAIGVLLILRKKQ